MSDVDDESRALAPPRETGAARVVAAVSLVVVTPPVIAAAVGGLALAVVVGMLSLVAGLISGVAFVYWQEHLRTRPDEPPQLPRARARLRK